MIALQNISKRYRTESIETTALDEINLTIQAGEFVSVMGPSGCGKSTLLNIMGLIDEPSSGEIAIQNQVITAYHSKAIARFRNEKLGFIFQSFHLIPELHALDNVMLPLLYRSMSGSERKQRAKEALDAVSLTNRTEHYPAQLSGGQKQRVAIARAIVGNPDIILADEPTDNLDNEIMDIMLRLNKERGTTIAMVTHDESMANKTSRLIRLYDGRQL